jgi:FkbM family methyltransferase
VKRFFGSVRNALHQNAREWLSRHGYRVIRDYRYPQINLKILEVAFAVLRAASSKSIRVLQIGAYEGGDDDPVDCLLDLPGVEAVLVEPQPDAFRILQRRHQERRNIRCIQLAVARNSGKGQLYRPKNQGHTAMATLLPDVMSYRFTGQQLEEIPVNLLTPTDLLTQIGWNHVDILQIDAEGYDWDLLQLFFEAGIVPDIINIEVFNLSREKKAALREALSDREYVWLDHGLDCFAISSRKLYSAIGRTR